MDDKKRIDPIWAAMREARGSDALDVSRIDWLTLHNELSFDVAICKAGHELGNAKLQRERQEMRREFGRIMRRARDIYKVDGSVFGIAQCYPLGKPEPLSVLTDLEAAAEQATRPPKDPPAFDTVGERIISALNEESFLHTLIARLMSRFKQHFKSAATRTYDIHRSSEPDSPFIRFVEAVFLEFDVTYKGQPYKRATIARYVTDILSGRSRRKRAS